MESYSLPQELTQCRLNGPSSLSIGQMTEHVVTMTPWLMSDHILH